ncbi:hypothetical protein JP74_18545 [Devosia sp. 17-2-E-8]|nr:hypothetical protein JP74_18545 [Devosia sp. 17-2-E-8]
MRAKHIATIVFLRTLATIAIVMGITLIIETCRHWIVSDMADLIGPYSQVGVTDLTVGQRYANAAIGLGANSFVLGVLVGIAMALLEHSGRGRARNVAHGYLIAGTSGIGYVVYGCLAVPIKDLVMTWGTVLTAMPMRFAPLETVYGVGVIALAMLTAGTTILLLDRHQRREAISA